MDGYTYHNIFATKGIEYLVVIAFLLIIAPFWIIVNRRRNIATQLNETLGILSAKLLNIPQGYYYTRNHMWAFLERSGLARIGMDDFVANIVGQANIQLFAKENDFIRKGELMAEVLQGDKKLQLLAPISGRISKKNDLEGKSAENLNKDPYDSGWFYEIKPSKWKAETASCFLAEEASKWFVNEVKRFRDFIAIEAGKKQGETFVFQEGGEIMQHALKELDEDAWLDFQKNFLSRTEV